MRAQILAAAADIPAAERQQWINRRRSPLDKMLSEQEAEALERWTRNEEVMSGRIRVASYADERVQTSSCSVAPLHDKAMAALNRHNVIRKRMQQRSLALLTVFTLQMARDREVVTPAQAGCIYFSDSKNKRDAYYRALRDAAAWLVEEKY